MKSAVVLSGIMLGVSLAATAAPLSFDFKDPKGVNNIVFRLDAPLEAISGAATGISGAVKFDPEHPASLQGRLVVTAESLRVPNPMMNSHLHSPMWLDAQRFPEITFVTEDVTNVKQDGNTTTADVTGTLTIKGTSKKITVPVKLTYLKDKLSARVPQMQGDLLALRANFKIKRSDFGINQGRMEDKVSDVIQLTLSLAGMAPK